MRSFTRHEHEARLFEALSSLYRDADALYEGARCDASTECCRFGLTGREPQVTSLELAYAHKAIKARGGPLRARKRALPLSKDEAREGICPLLTHEGKCSIYTARPLGCRTFFCARATVPDAPARGELVALVRKLQLLAAEHEPDGDKPRALRRGL